MIEKYLDGVSALYDHLEDEWSSCSAVLSAKRVHTGKEILIAFLEMEQMV